MRSFQTHVSQKTNLIDFGSIRYIFGSLENYFLGRKDFVCFGFFLNEVILTVGLKHLTAEDSIWGRWGVLGAFPGFL